MPLFNAWLAWCSCRVLIVTLGIEVFFRLYKSDLSVIIFQTYYRFIRVRALLHVFIHSEHVAWTVCIIWSCAFQCGPIRGWLARRIFPPYFPWCLSWLAYAHWVCFVLQYVFETHCTSRKILENSTPFLRVTLFGFSMSLKFSEVTNLS